MRRTALRAGVWVLVWVVGSAMMAAQATKTEEQIKAEAQAAQALYEQQNFVAALPLYEDLHRQVPGSLLYQERLAMALLGGAQPKTDAEKQAVRERARNLLLDAQKAGDNSNLLQVLLEKLNTAPAPPAAPVAGSEFFQQAEAAFSKGDLAGAVKLYDKALEVNPQYYAAATFAGDAEYKLGNAAEAGKYFAKAIAIDPDVETAHRYWGDCLEKAGDHQRAEEQFIQAVIAEPYARSPRLGLKQWADNNHARLAPPPITLPQRATPGKDDKNINITIDPSVKGPEASLAMMYSMNSALWRGEKFKKAYPNETQYRHSLAEEADNIRGMLAVMREQKIEDKKLSPSLRLLNELDKAGLLESWILLDDADQGIAQDYAAYRKAHRDLLAKYIAQYDVHPQ